MRSSLELAMPPAAVRIQDNVAVGMFAAERVDDLTEGLSTFMESLPASSRT